MLPQQQTPEQKETAKQLSRMGYKTRRCRKCGDVEYKSAYKWRCGKCIVKGTARFIKEYYESTN